MFEQGGNEGDGVVARAQIESEVGNLEGEMKRLFE